MSVEVQLVLGEKAREIDLEGVQWPPDALVAYAYENGEIVARQGLITLPHLEGSWVRPDRRSTRLAAQMVAVIEECLRQLGRSHAFAFVMDDDRVVADYLQRFNYKRLPVEVYVKNLAEAEEEAA